MKCDHTNESYCGTFSCGSVHYVLYMWSWFCGKIYILKCDHYYQKMILFSCGAAKIIMLFKVLLAFESLDHIPECLTIQMKFCLLFVMVDKVIPTFVCVCWQYLKDWPFKSKLLYCVPSEPGTFLWCVLCPECTSSRSVRTWMNSWRLTFQFRVSEQYLALSFPECLTIKNESFYSVFIAKGKKG